MTVERVAARRRPALIAAGRDHRRQDVIGLLALARGRRGACRRVQRRRRRPTAAAAGCRSSRGVPHLAGGRAGPGPNTLAAYRRDLAAYGAWLDARAPRSTRVEPRPTSSATSPTCAASGRAPASVARALVAVRSLHRFLAERAASADRPGRRRRGAARARRAAQGADRGRGRRR